MTEVTQQIVRESPDIEAYKLGLMKSAQALAGLGVDIPVNQVAGMTDLQLAALNQAGAGIGAYVPYLTGSGETLGDAKRFMQGSFGLESPFRGARIGAEGLITGAGDQLATVDAQGNRITPGYLTGFDPRTGIQPYMDPFQQQVIDMSMEDIRRQGDIARQTQSANAIQAGAFGGSRGELGRQELERNILDQQARSASQLRAAGFQDAATRAQQAFEAQQGRRMQGIQLGGQLGSALGNIAASTGQLGIAGTKALGDLGLQQGALGELGQTLGQRETDNLFNMGRFGQAQTQAELDALRSSQMQQLYEPYQRLGFLSDIYKGAPSTQMATTAISSPQQSPFAQMLGLGIAGLGAYGGAQRMGLFGAGG